MVIAWYKKAFGGDYLRIYPHRNDAEAHRQVAFLEEVVSLREDSRILDLCCGDGRHTVALAQRGYRVIGVDLSWDLLQQARRREKASTILLIRGDMRYIPCRPGFDLVSNFFTSFGYFATDAENCRVLKEIARVLNPGGYFLIDYLNHTYVKSQLVPRDTRQINDLTLTQQRWVDQAQGRVNKRITVTAPTGSREYLESVRMYPLEEMQAMLQGAGLVAERLFGDFDGQPYQTSSPRMIIIGSKKS